MFYSSMARPRGEVTRSDGVSPSGSAPFHPREQVIAMIVSTTQCRPLPVEIEPFVTCIGMKRCSVIRCSEVQTFKESNS